jgi:hypothetical protein
LPKYQSIFKKKIKELINTKNSFLCHQKKVFYFILGAVSCITVCENVAKKLGHEVNTHLVFSDF